VLLCVAILGAQVRIERDAETLLGNDLRSVRLVQCVRKVAVHLQKVLEVMSTSV
jgi:hypothetical protein